MPKYLFKHTKCGQLSEHIVPHPMLESETMLLECGKCLHIDMLVKQPNVNTPAIRGCSHPKENG
jgi:hypothetical protein